MPPRPSQHAPQPAAAALRSSLTPPPLAPDRAFNNCPPAACRLPQGQADLEHPLVQQMRERAGQGDAPAMLRLFEAALAPLEGTLRRGEPPGRGDVPPPLAWKLYLAALATTRAHAQRFSTIVDLMDSLGVPPQVGQLLRCDGRQRTASLQHRHTVLC